MTPAERAYNGDRRHMRPLDPIDEQDMMDMRPPTDLPLLEGVQRGTQWPVAVALMVMTLGLFALIGWIVWVIAR